MPNTKLFLLDAHALCYRSFYAIKGLTSSKGQATNAVYGFVNTLRKLLKDYEPQYFAVCFDMPGKTFRAEKYAEYKIQRPSMPDALVTQIPMIREVLNAYHLPIFESVGFEADDVIATIAHKMRKKDVEIIIVSDDKDLFQLVDDHVKVLSVRKAKMFTKNEVQKEMGVLPRNITDFIGLAGDSVDNIPGVRGIGDVSARKLINEYGDLDRIMRNVETIEPKRMKDRLQEHRDMAFFSKELAELEKSVPIKFDLDVLKIKDPDDQKLFALFNDLEFRKFAAEYAPTVKEETCVSVNKLGSDKDIQTMIKKIADQKCFAFCLDSIGGEDQQSMFESYVDIALADHEVYHLAMNNLKEFKDIFLRKDIAKVTFDLKVHFKLFNEHKCPIEDDIFDVMLAGYLLSPARNTDINALSWEYLRKSSLGNDQKGAMADLIYQLHEPLKGKLMEQGLWDLFNNIEMPLARVIFRMEGEGVKIDDKLLKKLSKDCDKKINGLMDEVFKMADEQFNINSPKQLSQILFAKLKLPVLKKTKTGFSTNESVLVRLADIHPLPAKILEYRQLTKLKTTYLDALPKLINSQTGKIHAHFNQTGTETGRLSSHTPNLQNIPIRTELGRKIRQAFIPSESERIIVAADYSQIELRILAHLSQDKTLMEAFQKGQDIHQYTASLIFDVKNDEVTEEMRVTAKRVNFGIVYGMSAFGLAKDLNIIQVKAQEFIDKYFLRYPAVRNFMDNSIAECRRTGYVTTLLHRRRYIPEINDRNQNIRQFAERQAINTPVQGSAADLMKLAMIRIQEAMDKQKLKSAMIINVHDEIVFDVLSFETKKLKSIIREQMEGCLPLSVPIKVSINEGPNWMEAK